MSAGEKRVGTTDGTSNSGLSKNSKVVTLTFEDLDRLNCPICFELPKAEVYQCSKGHSVCSQCIANLKNCPTCGVLYQAEDGQGTGKIRNHFAEEILSTLRFNCSWKEQGCDRHGMTGQQVTEHEERCSFSPKPIKLCRLLFRNSTCAFEVSRKFLTNPSLDLPVSFQEHLRAQHYPYQNIESKIRSGHAYSQVYAQLSMEALCNQENQYLRGCLLRLVDTISGDPVGIFMLWVYNHSLPSDGKQASWLIVRVTDPPKLCSVRVKFTLKSGTTSEDNDGALNLETSWDGKIMDLYEFQKFYAMSAAEKRERIKFFVPVSHLRLQYGTAAGGLALQYKFTVTPHKPVDSSSDDEH